MISNPAWLAVGIAAVNLILTAGMVGFAWGVLAGRLKTLESGQDAIWSEIVSIKKALGLANGGPSKFVERMEIDGLRDRADETKKRLDSHSERLRSLEIGRGN